VYDPSFCAIDWQSKFKLGQRTTLNSNLFRIEVTIPQHHLRLELQDFLSEIHIQNRQRKKNTFALFAYNSHSFRLNFTPMEGDAVLSTTKSNNMLSVLPFSFSLTFTTNIQKKRKK
jgi:hypothetical protein